MSRARNTKAPIGIVGDSVASRSLRVPEDHPDPWPVNQRLNVVGRPTPRVDGLAKVTGSARYTTDVALPGMLYARRLVSPHPHARIVSVDLSAARRTPGVRAIALLERDLAGARSEEESRPVQSYPTLRYCGQPFGAIAATSPEAAEEAVARVKVIYERLPFVVDIDAAMRPDAPAVFPAPAAQAQTGGGGGGGAGARQRGNVRGPMRNRRHGGEPEGDIDAGFAKADAIVETTYETQVQTHSALEPHGVVADWRLDGLTVWASTQSTKTVRAEIAQLFALPLSRVHVIAEFMGGGFGAKFGLGNYGYLAIALSRQAGAPVRLILDRREEHLSVGNRPNSRITVRLGGTAQGLTAMRYESVGSAGTGTGAGTAAPAAYMYPCPNREISESDVFINAGPGAAFRAPGHPQGCFALEQAIDALSESLGIDPLEYRDRIDFDDDRNLGDSAARRLERRIGAQLSQWSKRQAPGSTPGPIKRGVGFAQSIWYRFVDPTAACTVRIERDGSVGVLSAVQDIGTGIRTNLAQVVAEELALSASDVDVRIGDTRFVAGATSGGSRTTASMAPAARLAAFRAKRAWLASVAESLEVDVDALRLGENGLEYPSRDGSRRVMPFRRACGLLRDDALEAQAARGDDYGGFERKLDPATAIGRGALGGVQFAHVAVDVRTGVIHVERVVAVHDCGRPINPLAIHSQINGGVIQGVSYALYEDRILDRNTGHMVNPTLDSYKIAGAREVPEIDIHLIEKYDGTSCVDASGIGEPATIPTAAAIANAVYNATGRRIRRLPMTPSTVLAALREEDNP